MMENKKVCLPACNGCIPPHHFESQQHDANDVKITLSVDINMFYKIKIESVSKTPKEEAFALVFEKNLRIEENVACLKLIVKETGENHFEEIGIEFKDFEKEEDFFFMF
uniref:Uncharacterized protein n=1 Tax=Panagrolaimus davidi TaxID=227884 RepID=A0A914PKG4_9BILA